ncbi:MAG: molybdate ABC transporter substrate-binding protein [Deltaproteobacteria bacterium]|nr:molybdate ABC transporter substrate-binding protein [Deltaproteobacteria bacterium]
MTVRGVRVLAGVLLLATVCAAPAAASERLLVFAAASLQGAVDAVAQGFERAGGARVALSFAASSTLARQIEQGAAADVYVSASPKWMDRLERRRWLRPGTRGDLLGNRLVLVAPAGSAAPVTIHSGFPLVRLLEGGRLAMGDPSYVPAGVYAKAALQTYGVWKAVAGRVAGTADVRRALALVARGEAPYGIVYVTDALADPKVAVVGTFPVHSHPPIHYSVAVPAASDHPQAERFLSFLWSPKARSVFEAHGFTGREP